MKKLCVILWLAIWSSGGVFAQTAILTINSVTTTSEPQMVYGEMQSPSELVENAAAFCIVEYAVEYTGNSASNENVIPAHYLDPGVISMKIRINNGNTKRLWTYSSSFSGEEGYGGSLTVDIHRSGSKNKSGKFLFVLAAGESPDTATLKLTKNHEAAALAANTKIEIALEIPPTPLGAVLPEYKFPLHIGRNEVRIKNPNAYAVAAGIRTAAGGGRDIMIPANGTQSVFITNGSYSIYFVYETNTKALYAGDGFLLNNNGIEIQLVATKGGNFGIRQVK